MSVVEKLEEGYCPECDERKIMRAIKKDGTTYCFCKYCGWKKTDNPLLKLEEAIKNEAEVGREIIYSLVEDTYDVHGEINGWEFNRENNEDIDGKWVRLSDVLKEFVAFKKDHDSKIHVPRNKLQEKIDSCPDCSIQVHLGRVCPKHKWIKELLVRKKQNDI